MKDTGFPAHHFLRGTIIISPMTTTVEEVLIFLNDETNMHNVKLILVNLVFFEEKKCTL